MKANLLPGEEGDLVRLGVTDLLRKSGRDRDIRDAVADVLRLGRDATQRLGSVG